MEGKDVENEKELRLLRHDDQDPGAINMSPSNAGARRDGGGGSGGGSCGAVWCGVVWCGVVWCGVVVVWCGVVVFL